MNFFRKDPQQDKYFVEIRNSLELAYWIASDIDHFIENFPELTNKKNLNIVFNNSIKLKSFLKDTKEKINYLNGVHRDCACLVADYIEFCIAELSFDQKTKIINESTDIKFSKLLSAEDSFRERYINYLLMSDIEHYRLRSAKQFSKACAAMIDFNSFIEDRSDATLAEKKREEILKYLSMAQVQIARGSLYMDKRNRSRNGDYYIASGLKEVSSPEYHEAQVQYNQIWKEILFVQKDYYSQFNENQLPEIAEINLVDHETNQYYSRLNEAAFKINKIILKTMNTEFPNFELLSPSTIKNQLHFLHA